MASLASGVSIYSAHMGTLPSALTALTTVASNAQGQTVGPLFANLPVPPSNSGAYTYSTTTSGTFSISNAGEGTSATAP